MSASGQAPEILVGIKTIAGFLGVSIRTAKHWAYEGMIPSFKIGHTVCARPAKLREWLDRQEQDASR